MEFLLMVGVMFFAMWILVTFFGNVSDRGVGIYVPFIIVFVVIPVVIALVVEFVR